jgi:hypothetical protein
MCVGHGLSSVIILYDPSDELTVSGSIRWCCILDVRDIKFHCETYSRLRLRLAVRSSRLLLEATSLQPGTSSELSQALD